MRIFTFAESRFLVRIALSTDNAAARASIAASLDWRKRLGVSTVEDPCSLEPSRRYACDGGRPE